MRVVEASRSEKSVDINPLRSWVLPSGAYTATPFVGGMFSIVMNSSCGNCLYRFSGCWCEASGRCCGSQSRGMSSHASIEVLTLLVVAVEEVNREDEPRGDLERRHVRRAFQTNASLQTGKEDKNYGGDRSLLVFGLEGGSS